MRQTPNTDSTGQYIIPSAAYLALVAARDDARRELNRIAIIVGVVVGLITMIGYTAFYFLVMR